MAFVEELQTYVNESNSVHEPNDTELAALEIAGSFLRQAHKGLLDKVVETTPWTRETVKLLEQDYGLTLQVSKLSEQPVDYLTHIVPINTTIEEAIVA